jgi:hypothetical protein
MLLLVRWMFWFWELHGLLHLFWNAHLQQYEPFSTLKPGSCRKCYFQNLTVLTGKQCAKSSIFWQRLFSLLRYISFFTSPEWPYLEQTEPSSTFKHLRCRKYCFQNLTPFSQGNNVLEVPASKTDGFLSRGACVSSTSRISLFWTIRAYLHLETPKSQQVFLSKTNSIVTEKQCARCSRF